MTRLLLRYFFGFLLASVSIGILLYIIANRMQENSIIKMIEAPNIAVFHSLEKRLANIPINEQARFIKKIQPAETSQINLLTEQEISLSKKDFKKLNSGKAVTIFSPTQYYFGYGAATTTTYWKISGSKQVLKITSFSMSSLAQKISGWLTHLMKLDLQQTPINLWPQKIKEMEQIYHIPLALIHLNEIVNNQRILDEFTNHKMALSEPNSAGNIKYIYIPLNIQDFILKIGPISYSIYPQYNQLFLISIWLILSIIFMIIATWLFSRNLAKIYDITKQYSRGNFEKLPGVSQKSSLHELYECIIQMGSQLRQLIDNQRNITRFVAHDCKTPISTIRFAIHRLEKQPLPEEAAKQVFSIKEDISELNSMVDQFLSYERLEAQTYILKRQRFLISAWLKDCLEQYQKTLKKINLISSIDENATLYADPQLLKQALTNLIDNALKYGGANIEISAKIESPNIVFQVADNGAAISESDKQIIFQPFTRLINDENRQIPGFGLGLAIVRAIVTAHHGKILVSDSHLGGTCFTIHLDCMP